MRYLLLLCLLPHTFSIAAALGPYQVMRRITRASAETSYKAVMTTEINGRTRRFSYYQKVNPDGTVYTLQVPLGENNAARLLTNDGGSYRITGSTVTRNDYIPKKAPVSVSVITRKDKDTIILDGREITRERVGEKAFAIYEDMADHDGLTSAGSDNVKVQEISFEGKNCYLLWHRYETYDGFCVRETIADQNSFLAYRRRSFDPSGKCTITTTFSDIEINPVFEDNLFELPKATPVVVAKTREEANKVAIAAINEQHSRSRPLPESRPNSLVRWGRSFGGALSHFFWGNISGISYALAILAVLISVAAGVMKFRRR